MMAVFLACVFTVTPAIARAVVSVDPALMRSIVANESAFRQYAVSPTGAQGYAQLEPATSRELGVCHPFDPYENIIAGTRYVRGLLDRFHGSVPLAAAGYNAGPGAVQRYGGIPQYAETQAYVRNVLRTYAQYRQPGKPAATIAPAPIMKQKPKHTLLDAFDAPALLEKVSGF